MADLAFAHAGHGLGFVADCNACGTIEADVHAISRAIRASAAWSVASTRDFRLSAAQAASLRSNPLARIAARFAVGFDARFTRPLGTALATLGLAGLVVGASGTLIGGVAGGAGDTSREGTYGLQGQSPIPAYVPKSSAASVDVVPPKQAPEPGTGQAVGIDPRLTVLAGSAGLLLGGVGLIRGSRGNRSRREAVGRPR